MLPFNAVIARTNGATVRRLGNARARLGAGEPFTVIFDESYESPLGIDVGRPSAVGLPGDLVTARKGTLLSVDQAAGVDQPPGPDALAFRVVSAVAEDGLIRLALEVVV